MTTPNSDAARLRQENERLRYLLDKALDLLRRDTWLQQSGLPLAVRQWRDEAATYLCETETLLRNG